MKNEQVKPKFIFEASWEVCNMVGGIYTVLASRAKTMVETYKEDNVVFIGPDLWKNTKCPDLIEDKKLYTGWVKAAEKEGLSVKVGRWNVPGKPRVILVNFEHYYQDKNMIYAHMWDRFGVDSLQAYGDYDEASMFAYATGVVIRSFYKYNKLEAKNVVAHFNEWMLGLGALYVKEQLPKVGTLFTTHATTVGRSIAGNGKPLYNSLSDYNGDQMARELNVEAKHSIEKITAQQVDCFTTVSQITARECKQLLEATPMVTPNGFEKDMVPTGETFDKKKKAARNKLTKVAESLLGYSLPKNSLLIATSGRYEYRNKGIDVLIDSLARLRELEALKKEIVAFIMVPAWVNCERDDLKEQLKAKKSELKPLDLPVITHWLHEMDRDPVLSQLQYLDIQNQKDSKVKVIFVPCYLDGKDGIFNLSYYDLLIGLDLTVFPSYYEPWGYTPLESVAFGVPTVTTSLAGFGMWMRKEGDERGMNDGVEVVQRDDYNFIEVSDEICNRIYEMSTKTPAQQKEIAKAATKKAGLADWAHFFKYYEEAYAIALSKVEERTK